MWHQLLLHQVLYKAEDAEHGAFEQPDGNLVNAHSGQFIELAEHAQVFGAFVDDNQANMLERAMRLPRVIRQQLADGAVGPGHARWPQPSPLVDYGTFVAAVAEVGHSWLEGMLQVSSEEWVAGLGDVSTLNAMSGEIPGVLAFAGNGCMYDDKQ